MTISDALEARFMPEPNSGCWLWISSITEKGYGSFRGKRAHRVVYEEFRGPIPEGLTLDHHCRVRSCVNPDHLEPVPGPVNVARGFGPTAINARKSHCKRGQALSEGEQP